MNSIDEIIRDEIKRNKSISFARLMELALYCPQFGYYDRIENRIGPRGDYYTSVSSGRLFGELLASQFAEWMERFPDGEIQLLEAGAHDGRLAADILGWLSSCRPKQFQRLQYWIIEPRPALRTAQGLTLEQYPANLRWFPEWQALPQSGARGVIFSNELLDAMPVHRLGWDAKAGVWFEWGVTIRGADLAWTRLDLNPDLAKSTWLTGLPRELLAVLPDGFVTELCPAAETWWRQAAKALRQGWLLTFDYGLETEEFLRPSRSGGTLRAYYRHHVNTDLLARPGEQDLTAHVNFTALRKAGEAAGLHTDGLLSQSEFLTPIFVNSMEESDAIATPSRSREFHTLTHPEHLGRAFSVLVQSRDTSTASR